MEGIVFHNEKYMNCCFVVHYGQSLFLRSSFKRERARHENDHARDWRRETEEARSVSFFLPPSFLAPKWMIVEGYIISNVYINIVVLAF